MPGRTGNILLHFPQARLWPTENSCLMETLRVSHPNKHDFPGDILMSFHGAFRGLQAVIYSLGNTLQKVIETFSWVTSLHIEEFNGPVCPL